MFSRNDPCKIDGNNRRMCNRTFSYEIFFFYIHVTTILLLYTQRRRISIKYKLQFETRRYLKIMSNVPFSSIRWMFHRIKILQIITSSFSRMSLYVIHVHFVKMFVHAFSQINHYERSLYRLIIAYDIFAEIDYFNHTKRFLSYQFTLLVLLIHCIDDKHDSEKFFRR